MNKKDRIALVITILGIFISLIFIADGFPISFLIWLITLVYWGYRFIKNDISFLNIKEK